VLGLKILSWNLNHRTQRKKIPFSVINVISELAPDVVCLNEYVDGDGRPDFKAQLRDEGFQSVSISSVTGRHNQVLLATRKIHEVGEIEAPVIDGMAESNYLHAKLGEFDLDVVALRAPMYKKRADLRAYWETLRKTIEAHKSRRVIFIGDLNCDPALPKYVGSAYMLELRASGWQIPEARGDWSYISMNGAKVSRLDHVIASPQLERVESEYVTRVRDILVAGQHSAGPISDHAILVVNL